MNSDSLIQVFKDCFFVAADQSGDRKAASKLKMFLADCGEPHGPHHIAAAGLHSLCVDDGLFNNYRVGIHAVLSFLERATAVQATEQAVRDLRTILEQPPVMVEALKGWAESHFPT